MLPFAACLLLWGLAGRRASVSYRAGLEAVGRASAPLLGLVTAWCWYELTGDQFHLAHGCDIHRLDDNLGLALIAA